MRACSENELATLLEVPYGVAAEFKAEAELMHVGAAAGGAQQMMQMLNAEDGGGGGVKPQTWKEFAGKLQESGSQSKVPTKKELDTFGSRLMHYVAAQDGAAASVVREFFAEPATCCGFATCCCLVGLGLGGGGLGRNCHFAGSFLTKFASLLCSPLAPRGVAWQCSGLHLK